MKVGHKVTHVPHYTKHFCMSGCLYVHGSHLCVARYPKTGAKIVENPIRWCGGGDKFSGRVAKSKYF